MKKMLLFSALSLFILLIACNGQDKTKAEQKNEQTKMTSSEKIYYYTCPMPDHKTVFSDSAGTCPECGMNLVPVVEAAPDSADYYGCTMPEHSHIRMDKPGNCPECNMKLVPMRLKKDSNMKM